MEREKRRERGGIEEDERYKRDELNGFFSFFFFVIFPLSSVVTT